MKLRALSLTLVLTACYGDVCEEFFDGNCPGNGGTGGVGATGGTGGVGADGGTGGNMGGTGGDGGSGAGGATPGCTPEKGMAIGDNCGVFVGTEAGDGQLGTKGNPYLSLQTAISALPVNGESGIYICEGFEDTGSFTIPEGVRLYGRLECGSYIYSTARNRPLISGLPNQPVVRIEGDATLSGMSIEAADATADTESSIGILVTSGELSLDDSSVTARMGGPGTDGVAPGMTATGGNMGSSPAGNGCTGTQNNGGAGGPAPMCLVGGPAGAGGGGGAGLDGGSGQAGLDGGPMSMGGNGGQAQVGATNCTNGSGGISLAGMDATPAPLQDDLGGLIDASPFYLIPVVEEGADGVSGRGAGGGGGAQACGNGLAGPGGGGGGSGGCGGAGGKTGSSGGASFGIVLLGDSSLEALNSTITAGSGGSGGDGQLGQIGGAPGTGANPQNGSDGVGTACSGNAGGKGGNGGPGAGGAGGPAAAIARTGAQAVILPGTTLDHGMGGTPGSAASGGMNGTSGFSCTGNQVLNVPDKSCEGI